MWQQTMVARLVSSDGSLTERRQQHQTFGGPTYSEVLQPASDPLILRCLAALEATSGSSASASSQQASSLALAAVRLWQRLLGAASGDVRWLPTGCLQLLDTLMQVGGWVAPAALAAFEVLAAGIGARTCTETSVSIYICKHAVHRRFTCEPGNPLLLSSKLARA